jgi:hypothetical protein
VGDMNASDVDEALRAPRAIFAPDGTQFTVSVKTNEDASSVDQLFRTDFLRYELIGPNELNHEWIFTNLLELIPDPSHEDVPRAWTLKAEIAISGWCWLTEAALD